MVEPLAVGIVGAGYWGRNLIRNFSTSPDWQLAWVCDKDQKLAASRVEAMPAVRVTGEFSEVLSDETVDAVAIATPVGTHYELAMAALTAGKHVLVEKPLVATLAEGERLVAFAAEHDLRLMTDHTFCYTAAVRYIANMVDSGELGTFHYLDSVRINLGLVQPDVDVFWDLAPHDLSILDFILPDDIEAVSVSATGADPLGIGKATLGYLSIGLSTGAIANVHVNWMSPVKVRHTIVAGSKKMIVWDDNNPSQRVSVYDVGITTQNDAESRLRRLVGYRTGDMVAPALADTEALSLMVGEFAAAITEHRDPLTSGADGLAVLRILDAARRSLAQGGGPVAVGATT
ncbi:MAG: gfo/Idh/MocA family oxidoreductase [Armatimonadetes bacterium]|nr:MAG: gfo/Idh/MocA family oxidoreductase [Armatimonadota bacterium]